jgi:Gram-negative porin
MNNYHKGLLLSLTLATPLSQAMANDIGLIQRVKILEQQLQQVKSTEQESADDTSAKFYSTFRPGLTWSDNDQENNTDVTDFLSRVGMYTETKLANDWTAFAHGEWSVDIKNNGDFGKARKAYVGFDSPYGRVEIGKQRPVQYTLIAEYVDIFNHASAPFAYDSVGPFFVDNQVLYKKSWDNITFMAAAQFNGSSGDNYSDMVNTGLAYDKDGFHIAATYLSQQQLSLTTEEHELYAISVAKQFNDQLYVAAAYQDRDTTSVDGNSLDSITFDIAMAYKISEKYQVKAGYFIFDDGLPTMLADDYDGYNLTLERGNSTNFQTHIELLTRNFDNKGDFAAVTVGFKYNFSIDWVN